MKTTVITKTFFLREQSMLERAKKVLTHNVPTL